MARRKKEPERPDALRLVLLFTALGLAVIWTWRVVDEPVLQTVREVRARDGLERTELHKDALLEAARLSQLDVHLLAALAFRESSGHLDAVSEADALGLFQLRMPTAVERAQKLGLEEPTREDLLSNARLSARLGSAYFRYLVDRFDGSVEAALVAYNTGPTRLARWIREHGSYAAWRAERDAAGDSHLLAYAADILHYTEVFAERGAFVEP